MAETFYNHEVPRINSPEDARTISGIEEKELKMILSSATLQSALSKAYQIMV
jgi:hypothetical protein